MNIKSIEPNQLSRLKGMAQWLNREPIGQSGFPAIEPLIVGSIRLNAAQLIDKPPIKCQPQAHPDRCVSGWRVCQRA